MKSTIAEASNPHQSMTGLNTTIDILKMETMRYKQLTILPYYDPRYSHHFPWFNYGTVDLMLRDPRICYGLTLIKGPIYANTKFFSSTDADDPEIQQAIIDLDYQFSFKIESSNAKVEEYVLKSLNRFWQNGLRAALAAVDWGYSPNQVIWKKDPQTGLVVYEKLVHYGIHDVKPVEKHGKLIGIYIRKKHKFLPIPKSFVHVYDREYDEFTGRSRLRGAHIPWHETWMLGGARDIRRNWFFKCSYDSGTLYVPQEDIKLPDGTTMSALEAGAKFLELRQTGSYLILPKPNSARGKNERTWDYEAPKSNTTPQGMEEYLDALRTEELEGLGIPPEVIENSDSNGMGSSSGRKIPLLAFYASIAHIPVEVVNDFAHQVIEPGLRVNGLPVEYEITRIIPKTLQPPTQMEQASSGTKTPKASSSENSK